MKLPVNYENLSQKEIKGIRERYIVLQKGKCIHCENSLYGKPSEKVMKKYIKKELFPDSFFKYPIHLHHNHDTGMTIGAIHCECNAVLWQYKGE